MTEQERKIFEALLEMFATEGWKLYQERLIEHCKNLKDAAHTECVTGDQWHTRRGQIAMIEQVIGWEQAVRLSAEPQEEVSLED